MPLTRCFFCRAALLIIMKLIPLVLVAFAVWFLLGAGYCAVTYDDATNNCKHQSIALHNLLAAHGIESHYEGVRLSPTLGHVWVVVDVWGVGVPIESTSLGVVQPMRVGWYVAPDWVFATTEELLAFR